jgi:hypothetical protein
MANKMKETAEERLLKNNVGILVHTGTRKESKSIHSSCAVLFVDQTYIAARKHSVHLHQSKSTTGLVMESAISAIRRSSMLIPAINHAILSNAIITEENKGGSEVSDGPVSHSSIKMVHHGTFHSSGNSNNAIAMGSQKALAPRC